MQQNPLDISADAFAAECEKTAVYPRVRILLGDSNNIDDAVDAPWLYPVLGLVGEAGEMANQAKKILRDDGGILTSARAEKLTDELSDVTWYVAETSRGLGRKLSEVMLHVVGKLHGRASRGTLRGSGDRR
jgi:NTP pyrophosphatase (non-canonical NTP hydrolase)